MRINQLRRRDFITLIAGAALYLPQLARAQRGGKPPTVGFIGPSTTVVDRGVLLEPFVQRLTELGWVDGRSVTVDYRPAEGSLERASEIAADFARQNVDVIVTGGDAQALAAKRATTEIPIVFGAAGDPVGNGLVASLAHPGGNVTGSSLPLTETAGKRIELLRELIPDLRRSGLRPAISPGEGPANIGVPMLREGIPLGVIVVLWAEPGPIPKAQEELLKTFADQAVIAIENVRCSTRYRRGRATWASPSNNRRQPPTCSRSSAARPSIYKWCSILLLSQQRVFAKQTMYGCTAATGNSTVGPRATATPSKITSASSNS